MASIALIKRVYGVTIVENGYYDANGKYRKLYDMYSADECCWDKGKPTIKACYEECLAWSGTLRSIKRICEKWDAEAKKII